MDRGVKKGKRKKGQGNKQKNKGDKSRLERYRQGEKWIYLEIVSG